MNPAASSTASCLNGCLEPSSCRSTAAACFATSTSGPSKCRWWRRARRDIMPDWHRCRPEATTPPRLLEETMLKMNYWTDKWDLHVDVCPCDVHFNDWVTKQKLRNKQIYHFGSGTHHVVGIKQAVR